MKHTFSNDVRKKQETTHLQCWWTSASTPSVSRSAKTPFLNSKLRTAPEYGAFTTASHGVVRAVCFRTAPESASHRRPKLFLCFSSATLCYNKNNGTDVKRPHCVRRGLHSLRWARYVVCVKIFLHNHSRAELLRSTVSFRVHSACLWGISSAVVVNRARFKR